MGGVVSVSGKKSTSPDRVELALLAMEKQEWCAIAQKNYDASILFCGTAFKEFVDRHCYSDSVKLQDAVHDDQENEEEHHDNNESSRVIEKPQTKPQNKKENSGTARGRPRNGTNVKAAGSMVAEKAESLVSAESSAKKEDNNVAPEKRFSDFEVQFKKVRESGSGICELLETKSGHVEIGKLVRSFTRSRSTRSKILARSRSSKVGDRYHCGEKAAGAPTDYSTLYRLYIKEKSLSKDLERVELVKNCENLEIQDAVDRAQEAFNKIKKLSDDELQPLLFNLLKILHGNWKIMSDCHDKQHEILSEKSCYKPHEVCCDADHLIATDSLQTALQNWRNAFTSYILSQKSYIESLYNWSRKECPSLLKKGENDNGGTTLLTTLLGNWSKLKNLDDKEVTQVSNAMREFEKEVKKLRDQENKELEWKSKVNTLNEDIRKLVNRNKETRQEKKDEELNESKKKKKKKNKKTRQEKKDEELNELKKKLKNAEKAYQDSQTVTQKMVTNVFQERLALLFKSLSVFSKNAAEEYAEVARNHNIEVIN